MAGATTSEWPLALLLDETWLRVRRVLVHRLEGSGTWPSASAQRDRLQRHRAQGERIRRDLLVRVLGPEDSALICSESTFARASPRLPIRLPLVLAFGYELGWCLNGLGADLPDRQESAAELCAVFNLGISLFDLIHDRYPELIEPLGERIEEEALRRLERREACDQMGSLLSKVPEPELRILLRIIVWFYSHLPSDSATSSRLAALHSTLRAAYHAELSAASIRGGGMAVDVSRAKSTLPFAVIHHVASLSREGDRVMDALVDQIGTVFWLVDDLADIIPDFRDGAINSILARGSTGWKWSLDPAENRCVLLNVLSAGLIEEAVESVDLNLAAANRLLQTGALPPEPARRLSEAMSFFVRSWLE